LPGASVVRLPGGGHHPQQAAAAAFSGAVGAFLRGPLLS
jgi:hypothetical protein